MKKKPFSLKKTCFCIVGVLLFLSFNSFGQTYLPLTGGTLTGNLNLSTGTQLQAPYYGLSSFFTQPANSSNLAIFANSTTSTTDLVGVGWRFIPASSSSYLPSVFSIDGSGNTTISGSTYVAQNLGVGTVSPAAFIHVLGTTEQFRAAYDATDYVKFIVSSTGGLSITPTGTAISTTISGGVIFGNTNQNCYLPSTSGAINTTVAPYQFAGSTNTYFRAAIGGVTSTSLATAHNYSNFNVAATPFTLAASVNIPFAASAVINPIGTVTLGSGATVSNTATLYIDGANTQGANNYALYSNGATALNYFNGYVAINTPTMPAGYQFAVNGNMVATAVTVKLYSNWPDYVFRKNYKITSLPELKNYIDMNHHLPGMPSAAEVAANGLNLGEMNKLLTKKMEELTLYMIEKDKQLTIEEEQIKAQNEKIEKLEKAVELLLKKEK